MPKSNSTTQYSIYALLDPDTQRPYYVGLSKNAIQRYGEHLANPGIIRTAELISQRKIPALKILHDYDCDKIIALDYEQAWIDLLLAQGEQLYNSQIKVGVRFKFPDNYIELEYGNGYAQAVVKETSKRSRRIPIDPVSEEEKERRIIEAVKSISDNLFDGIDVPRKATSYQQLTLL